MEAAQLGLEFGELHHCALVPYKTEVKLMVQYQGFLALLWRSKSIKSVAARVVFEGDDFEVKYGMTTEIIHVPRFKSTTPICYWAGVMPTNGEFMCDVMSLDEVKDHAKQYAKGLEKADSPWNTAFDEMAKKTVLRRLMKMLAFSPESEIAKAIKVDEELFEADKKVSRMETFLDVTAIQDEQTPEELELAKKKLEHFCGEAERLKIDVSNLVSMLKKEDYDDAKKVNALADTIAGHLESAANARSKS